MFSLSYSLRILMVAMTLIALMVMPALAGAPPTSSAQAKPMAKPIMTQATALPVAGAVPCPPCEFCGMLPPDPLGPRVAAPQLEGASSAARYTPSYLAPAQGSNTMPAPMPMSTSMPQGMNMANQGYAPAPAQPVNTYVSNTPNPAGPNPSLGEVWMRHGGARLQYDALRGPIQVNTNGRPVKDPALVHLPPLYPTYTKPKAKRVATPRVVTPVAPAPKAVVPSNTSHKPAPTMAPAAQKLAPKKAPAPQAHKVQELSPAAKALTVPAPATTLATTTAPVAKTPTEPNTAVKATSTANTASQQSAASTREKSQAKLSAPLPANNTGQGISRPADPSSSSPYSGPASL